MTTTENTTPEPVANGAVTAENDAQALAAQVIPAEDLGELLEGAIRKAVTGQIGAKAKEIAEGVVADMLTPEVVAGMRQTAIYEAELALNPPVVEPEPEPEPEPVAENEEEEQQPEPPQKEYRSVKAFVENYVAQIYRREVSKPGSEKTLRWCPEWWRHGEATGRFKAMWRAFEALRQGETVEPSKWWLDHFDQHMDRLFDLQGPFKYCSVADGHSDKLVKLPCTPAPESVFGEHADEPTATDNPFEYITAAGFYVPEPRPVRSRIAWEVPE
ncbi:DUF4913 domain-containing protein [Nocardia sp. NPDC059239]|uniref:DUF4913 domain-containing protein n=1 Tax=unclassified Nocardia TaxID=2637762 RepID=UPI0036B3C32A